PYVAQNGSDRNTGLDTFCWWGDKIFGRTPFFSWSAPSCAAGEKEVKPIAVLSDEQYVTCHRTGVCLRPTTPTQQNFARAVYNMPKGSRGSPCEKTALLLYCTTL
ncbi:unnamed protein product, partial [Ectocarpus sp. 12 AP-2014]